MGLGVGRQSPRLGCKVGGWIGNRTAVGWNLSWVVLSCGLNVEPESMVNLAFVKNDSYEKGPDSVVVHVYVKEIRRDTSRVLFREQDFTLIFQTRWVGRQELGQRVHFRQDSVSHALFPYPSYCPFPGLLLQGWKLPETTPGLWAPHPLPLAGEAQVGGSRPPSTVPCPTLGSVSLAQLARHLLHLSP